MCIEEVEGALEESAGVLTEVRERGEFEFELVLATESDGDDDPIEESAKPGPMDMGFEVAAREDAEEEEGDVKGEEFNESDDCVRVCDAWTA